MTPDEPQPEPASPDDPLERAGGLLERLRQSRERLETTDDVDTVIEVLNELSEIAKQVEREIAEARRRAEAAEEPGGDG